MKNFQNITDEYFLKFENFIIDIWGVLHSGGVLYENTLRSLNFLQQNEKNVIFLSNAPRRASKVESFLSGIGVKKGEHYQDIVTSGETFVQCVMDKNISTAFYIGPDRDLDVLYGTNIDVTKNINDDFDIAIVTGPTSVTDSRDSDVLISLLERGYTLYCLNPDLFVVKSDGTLEKCAGLIATEYEKLGGKVIYFGKPYAPVYNETFATFGADFDINKTVAIGDGLDTDIAGGFNVGLKTVLCLSGLPSTQLQHVSLESYLGNHQILPDYVIDCL